MTAILRAPHRIYKRYQSTVERVITVVGLGLLVAGVLVSLPVYPPNWSPVLVALVIVIGLRWPLGAYILAVLSVVYPIYTISLYLAILFVAVAILGQRLSSHYLGATVLILVVPWLAKYNLHWAVPVLAGLWWGASGGFWIGGAAALWGKLLGGMAGLDIDWLMMTGQSPIIAGLMQRFSDLNALETLLKILQPFAPDATVLLYHLLQITLWAVVSLIIGAIAGRKWTHYGYPWSTLAITGAGIAVLIGGHIVLAGWLKEASPAHLNYEVLVLGAFISLVVSTSLEVTRRFFDLPVAPKAKKWVAPAPAISTDTKPQADLQPAQAKPTPVQLPELPEWEPPKEDNDLILLELD
jgi:hypothetical protein